MTDRADNSRAALPDEFLRPSRVAVVGASRDRTSVGGLLFHNLLVGGFDGAVYPVNPEADVVQSVAAYPTLSDCPAAPDLVVVAIPARHVPDVVDEAGRLGVPAVCVISAGFAESGGDGRSLEQDMIDRAARRGVRLVGPNCMGVLNAADGVRLNATFSSTFPPPGRIALLSQSGAVGLTVLDHANASGLGVSSFVSIGNSADVTPADLIDYWEHDADTDLIVAYLESFPAPREFFRAARRVGRSTPIIVVKSGRTGAGEQAASSHTAAIAAGEVAVDALFEQTGMIRADTLPEMFEVAMVLADQPAPTGPRIGIITNGGGPGILAADACAASGLEVPELGDGTQDQLREFLPAHAAFHNPVDLLAGADAESFARAVDVLAGSGEVDALIVISIPPIVTAPAEVAMSLTAAHERLPDDLPLVAVFMGSEPPPAQLAEAGIPSFSFPEEAVRAIGRAARWSAWRREPPGEIVRPDGIDRAAAQSLLAAARHRHGNDDTHDGHWLSTADAMALLGAYGIPLARTEFVTTPQEAGSVQQEFGVPVALKIDAPLHKSDIGAVDVGLGSVEEVEEAMRSMERRLDEHGFAEDGRTFLVQEMVDGDAEMAVGVNHDPVFGPLLMVGLGGELLELLGDTSVRVMPVTDRDVDAMVDSLRSRELLSGYRGRPELDVGALKDLLHRIDALIDDVPQIAELDMNPVFVRPGGVIGVDVRMRLMTERRDGQARDEMT